MTTSPARQVRLAVLGPIVLVTASCVDSGSLRSLEEHPRVDALMAGAHTIHRSQQIPEGTAPLLRSIALRPRGASEVVRFGELDEPRPYVFGDITDLTIAGDTVYVLESAAGEVRLFTTQGLHLASFGSKGPGPDELLQPRDMEIGANGELAVLERSGIKIFSIRDRKLALDRLVVPMETLGGVSLCARVDSLFVIRTLGPRAEKQIHVFRSRERSGGRDSTDLLTRFSDGYPLGGFLVRGRISRGPMVCPTPTDVVIAYHDLPLIEAYSIDGSRLWKSGLAVFNPESTFAGIDSEDGAPFIRGSDGAAHDRVQVLTTLPGGIILLQVARMSARDEDAGDTQDVSPTIDSYVLEVENGLACSWGTTFR